MTWNNRLIPLSLTALLLGGALSAQAATFRLSGIGYHTHGDKTAVLEDVPEFPKDPEIVLFDPVRPNPKFRLIQGATVYKVKISEISGDNRQGPGSRRLLLDFSDFHEPGAYELRVSGQPIKSAPIKINDFVYWDALKPVARTFYFQRCGQDVEDRDLKIFHAACHVKDALFDPVRPLRTPERENSLDVSGGWHNGDTFDKSVAFTALSVAEFMAMDEWNPKPFHLLRLDYPIFEPGYGSTDDLHHEIRAGLDWLRAMQRRDGAIYSAVVGRQPLGAISPDEDEQPRYIQPIGLKETAAMAAVSAMAARDFKSVDLGYSVKNLLTAEKTWAFLESHPTPANATEEDSDLPQRVWAAAELYAATGKPAYHHYFLTHWSEVPIQPVSWKNPALLGFMDYLFYAKQPDSMASIGMKSELLAVANRIADSIESDPYGAGLAHFGEHSNREIAARAGLLLNASRVSGQSRFREMASRSAAYLTGVNPLGVSYVTGLGDPSVKHLSHPWWKARMKAEKNPPAGYMTAGPDETPTDPVTPQGIGMMSYVDNADATSVNRSTLLDNAALAYLLGGLNTACNEEPAPKNKLNPQEGLPEALKYKLAPERPKAKTKSSSKNPKK